MYANVLVPVDGSPGERRAVATALSLASTADATIHALSVVEPADDLADLGETDREAIRRSTEARGREATADVMALAEDAGVEVVRHVREGRPHREIVAYAEEAGVDLIVMGTRGELDAADARLGSTTERTLALAEVPVLAVPPDADAEPTTPEIDRIVVPIDGSDAAERAAENALDLAAVLGADVDAIYVIDRTVYDLEDAPRSIVGLLREGGEASLAAVAEAADERGVGLTARTLRGVPEAEILAYADGVDTDLLAMGTRGRGGVGDRLLGSTTVRVIRRGSRPVLASA